MKSKKALIIGMILGAVGAWAVWYFFIREKTLGEKIEDAGQEIGRSVDKMLGQGEVARRASPPPGIVR